jgi:Protein tyrosine and serine/threonine kinase
MEKNVSILNTISKTKNRTILIIIIIVIFIWGIFVGFFYVMMFYEIISQTSIRLIISLFNLVAGGLVLYAIIYFFSKYLFIPFKSNTGNDKLMKLTKIVIVFTVGRLYKGTIGLLEVDISSSLLIDLYQIQDSSVLPALILITTYIISELLAFSLVMDYGFIYIFLFSDLEYLEYAGLHIKRSTTSENEEIMSSISNPISEKSNPVLDSSEIENLKFFTTKKSGFGKIFHGSYKGQEIAYREIKFPRISGHMLEKVKKEIANIKNTDIDCLVPVYGTVFNLPMICIVSAFMAGGSLHSFIHQDSVLNIDQKISVIEKVAFCIKELHMRNRFHGHLSSHNFLFDRNNNVKISDFGLEKLKKYSGMVLSYVNKSAWSSPEQLLQESRTVYDPQSTDDVFSFGVIAWEIVSQKIPHQGLSLDQIKENLSKNNTFDLPNIPNPLSKLIKNCTNKDKNKRPDIKTIYSNILSMS